MDAPAATDLHELFLPLPSVRRQNTPTESTEHVFLKSSSVITKRGFGTHDSHD